MTIACQNPGIKTLWAVNNTPFVASSNPLPILPRISHWFHTKESIIYGLFNLGHSSFVAGMRVAPKQQELDAAAALGHFVTRPDLVSFLSEQPQRHQCLCDVRKVGRFRRAQHDVCSRSKLVATSVSISSLTVDIPTKGGGVNLDAFFFGRQQRRGTDQQNRTRP
jgi:hypothetical protein